MRSGHPGGRLVFVTSCFNEEGNVRELHRRCRAVHQRIRRDVRGAEGLTFAMVIADNCSHDATLAVLEELVAEDPEVLVLANASNYGPEASVANALAHTREGDLVLLLASDLQDPPELALEMVERLLSEPGCDGVLAVKSRSSGSPSLRMCRRLYYVALGYSSRLRLVPGGFHGFGVYPHHALQEALELWGSSGWSLRLCLLNGCPSPSRVGYEQAERNWGSSTYQGWAYPKEALQALLAADSTGSRLAFLLGSAGLLAAGGVGIFLLLNWLGGRSGYERGIPTVMALVLGSFAAQMLMIALLSRQVEEIKLAGRLRPRVRHRIVGCDS
jgi:glycosyltransferase involved in cell wall biosynthesis